VNFSIKEAIDICKSSFALFGYIIYYGNTLTDFSLSDDVSIIHWTSTTHISGL